MLEENGSVEQSELGKKAAVALKDIPFTTEEVPLKRLKAHPENYQEHPDDQIAHLRASIRKFGPFRNAVIAREDTLLAGHGITKAARLEGYETWPCKRYDLDPYDALALMLLVADNETGNLAERNDVGLVGILRTIESGDPSRLLGTGYDDMMVSNLEMVTRPPDDIRPHNEGDHWVGLPDYEPAKVPYKVIIQFDTDEERHEFLEMIGAKEDPAYTMVQTRVAISMWWPLRDVKADRKNAMWQEEGEEDVEPPGLTPEEVQAMIREQEQEMATAEEVEETTEAREHVG